MFQDSSTNRIGEAGGVTSSPRASKGVGMLVLRLMKIHYMASKGIYHFYLVGND